MIESGQKLQQEDTEWEQRREQVGGGQCGPLTITLLVMLCGPGGKKFCPQLEVQHEADV